MSFKSYRQESRSEWGTSEPGPLSREQIKMGALLRIADAVEKMAASYDQMREHRDYQKRRADFAEERERSAQRKVAALRGVITKMRKAKR